MTSVDLCEKMKKEGKVWMNDGVMYGDPEPYQHIRINIACPKSRMMEGLKRMAEVVKPLL